MLPIMVMARRIGRKGAKEPEGPRTPKFNFKQTRGDWSTDHGARGNDEMMKAKRLQIMVMQKETARRCEKETDRRIPAGHE